MKFIAIKEGNRHVKRTNNWVKWTGIEITRLKQLVDDGMTVTEIAADLGRSFGGVSDKKRRLGLCTQLPKLSWSDPKLLAEIIKFKMAGWLQADIAKVYDVSEMSITHMLCENGFGGFLRNSPTEQHRWSEFELHGLRKYLRKGYSFERICTYFPRRTSGAVRYRIWKMTRYWLSPEQLAERERARRKFLHLPEIFEGENRS